MTAKSNIVVSVAGRPPALVPADQLTFALRRTSHVPKLHDRLEKAMTGGGEVTLSESEALLLLAEIRHRTRRSDIQPMSELIDALLGERDGDLDSAVGHELAYRGSGPD
jgi:hypothetical protein